MMKKNGEKEQTGGDTMAGRTDTRPQNGHKTPFSQFVFYCILEQTHTHKKKDCDGPDCGPVGQWGGPFHSRVRVFCFFLRSLVAEAAQGDDDVEEVKDRVDDEQRAHGTAGVEVARPVAVLVVEVDGQHAGREAQHRAHQPVQQVLPTKQQKETTSLQPKVTKKNKVLERVLEHGPKTR